MTGRNSSATNRAIRLVQGGMSIRKAAKAAGVAPSTITRALKRLKEAK